MILLLSNHVQEVPDSSLEAIVLTLDHIQLAMPQGKEVDARSFYGGVLRLQELEKPDLLKSKGGVWFRLGAHELHLGVETPFAPAKKAHPAFRVEDLGALVKRLKDAGYSPIWDDAIPKVRRFHTHDVFGNRLEFLQHLGQT